MSLLALVLAGLAPLAHAATGGPDAYGYTYIDSNEPGGPVYFFDDISTTGTLASAASAADDSQEQLSVAGFTFPFYGQNHTTFVVGTNGGVYFTNVYLTLGNVCMPGSAGMNALIAGFWDDLNPSAGGNIYYQLKGTAGVDRRLIVQFHGVYRYSVNLPITMQYVLWEDGRVHLTYSHFAPTGKTMRHTVWSV